MTTVRNDTLNSHKVYGQLLMKCSCLFTVNMFQMAFVMCPKYVFTSDYALI